MRKRWTQERIGHCIGGKCRTYRIWINMIGRCENPNIGCYRIYGGRGIRVCDRWRNSYAAFFEDMGHPPSSTHQLDRWPNNDGNYEPGNCRWATPLENARNSRKIHWISFEGKTKPLSEWARQLHLTHSGLLLRLKRLSIEEALSREKVCAPVIHFGGVSKTVSEWAESLGITNGAVHFRIKNWGIEAALSTPCHQGKQHPKPNKPTLKKI